MGIVDEDIVRVRSTADIVAIVTEHLQLRRVGRRWQGLCPFHAEKSPSFSVNAEEGLYYCFGCGAKGDVITFVREIEHLDFVGAVEKLAASCGVTLHYTDADEGAGRKRRAALVGALERAVEFYHQRLLTAPDAGAARSYLRSRGLSGDEVRHYKIGWAPDAWDSLARHLKVRDDVFVDAGLGRLNNWGGQTDAFRARVLFPIFDAGGAPVGFGGRVLPGADGPKYKNSTDSAIYHKSSVLYGLNWAKGDMVTAGEAIVCEGYTDVIGFAAAGIGRAVATCGTALTEEHFRVLRSFAGRVVLAFDADAAGQQAAERFYAWEQRFEIDVAVARLPAGEDPAELARRDPTALEAAVRDAEPFLGFRVRRVLDAARLDTPEGRARAADAAIAVIAEHPNPLVRDEYVMEVASRTRTDPSLLRERSRAGGQRSSPTGRLVREDRTRPQASGTASTTTAARIPGPELEALRLLVSRHDEVAPSLHPCLFSERRARGAHAALDAAGGSAARALEAVDEPTADLLTRLSVEQSDADVIDVVTRLLEAAARRELAVLQARASVSDDPLIFNADVRMLKGWLEALRDEHDESEAAEQLLVWLVHRFEEST